MKIKCEDRFLMSENCGIIEPPPILKWLYKQDGESHLIRNSMMNKESRLFLSQKKSTQNLTRQEIIKSCSSMYNKLDSPLLREITDIHITHRYKL